MKVYKNGKRLEKTYEEICEDIGVTPSSHFVVVNSDGTISYSAGKPYEIKLLKEILRKKHYRMSDDLKKIRV